MAWNSTRNDAFVARLYGFVGQLRALAWEAYQIKAQYLANQVADDPAFVDARGVARADAEAVVGIAGDVVALIQDGPVEQANRELVISRVLGGPVT